MDKKWIEERLKIIGEPNFIKSENKHPFEELNVGDGFLVFFDFPKEYTQKYELRLRQSIVERAWQHNRLKASCKVYARREKHMRKNKNKFFYIKREEHRIVVIRIK